MKVENIKPKQKLMEKLFADDGLQCVLVHIENGAIGKGK